MTKFAHIINGVSETENKKLFELQKITLASFINAKQNCKTNVEQLVCYHEDIPVDFGANFIYTKPLSKSIHDSFTDIKSAKLPLLKDVLAALYLTSNAEYLIYSNADIGIMPYFYDAIENYISKGHDAIVVNRRRVTSGLNSVNDLNLIYSELGHDHLGFDMFIFKRELFPKFILNDTFLGVPFVGNDLFYNIFCFASNPLYLSKQHLTFHIGMELIKEWGGKKLEKHNYSEFRKTTKALLPFMDITKFPGNELNFFVRHLKWLMNPTLSYPEMFKTDIRQLNKPRQKKKVYDPNYKKQSYYEWLLKKVNFD